MCFGLRANLTLFGAPRRWLAKKRSALRPRSPGQGQFAVQPSPAGPGRIDRVDLGRSWLSHPHPTLVFLGRGGEEGGRVGEGGRLSHLPSPVAAERPESQRSCLLSSFRTKYPGPVDSTPVTSCITVCFSPLSSLCSCDHLPRGQQAGPPCSVLQPEHSFPGLTPVTTLFFPFKDILKDSHCLPNTSEVKIP